MDKLKRYLSTFGEYLAPDIAKYRKGGSRAKLCYFCDSRWREPLPVKFIYDKIDETASETGAYCCEDCHKVVEKMYYVDPGWRTLGPSQKDKYKRLDLLRDGKFDSTVIMHNQFHKKYQSPWFKKGPFRPLGATLDKSDVYPDFCYVCKEYSNPHLIVQTPVDTNIPFITGGDVRICSACAEEFKEKTRSDLEEVLSEANYSIPCARCNLHYAVTPWLYSKRMNEGPDDEYICGDCAMETIYISDNYPQLDVSEMMTWHYGFECHYTGILFEVDFYRLSRLNTCFLDPHPACGPALHRGTQPYKAVWEDSHILLFYKGLKELTVRILERRSEVTVGEYSYPYSEKTYINDLGSLISEVYNTFNIK